MLGAAGAVPALAFRARVAVLPPAARMAAGALRAAARAGLLWMCVALLLDEALRTNTLAQMRTFAALFLTPEAAAWCVLFLFSAKASIVDGSRVLTRGAQRFELAVGDIAALRLWSVPLPASGLWLQLVGGQRWRYTLALADPAGLGAALGAAGGPALQPPRRTLMQTYAQARMAMRRSRLDHPFAKYVLLPLALTIPAFHLQQQIAYDGAVGAVGAVGEYYTTWSIGVVLSAALLRLERDGATRRGLQRAGHAALLLSLPAWLLLTVYAA